MTAIHQLDLVIPVRNEQASLLLLFAPLAEAFNAFENFSWRVICVDDGSSDASWQLLNEIAKTNPQLKAIRLTRGFGKEAALEAGLRLTDAPWVLVMDADLEHPPALIAEMIHVQQLRQTDIVTAIRSERPSENLLKRGATNVFFSHFASVSALSFVKPLTSS